MSCDGTTEQRPHDFGDEDAGDAGGDTSDDTTDDGGTDTDTGTTEDTGNSDTDPFDPDSWICDEMGFAIERVIPDMLIVLDRSGSMSGDSWDTVRNTIYSVTSAMDQGIWFGLMVYPAVQDPDACVQRGRGAINGCEPSHGAIVEVAAETADAIRSELEPMVVCGATPTAPSLGVAGEVLSALTTDHPAYVLLATDGAPNCNLELDGETCSCTFLDVDGTVIEDYCAETPAPALCLDDTRSYENIDALLAAGINVYVIGIRASLWTDVLNEMASHGGTSEAYMAEDAETIQSAFEGIVGSIATCEFDMRAPDPTADPNLVNFYFDGTQVPMDPYDECDNGWAWVDETHAQVTFCGTYCDMLMNNEVVEVNATFGCPTLI